MGRRAPQTPSAGTRSGVPAGSRSAWWPRISGAGRALSACPVLSSIRRPVSDVSIQCPRMRCPRDRCPVWASRRPGVRCPVCVRRPASDVRCPVGRPGIWTSGVRYPSVPASAVSEPSEFVKRRCGEQPHGEDGRVGVVARTVSTTGCRLPESEPGARSWRRPCWASGGIGLDLAVVVEGGWAVARSAAWPTRIGWMRGEDRLSVEATCAARSAFPVAGLRGTSHPGHCCSGPRKRYCAGSL